MNRTDRLFAQNWIGQLKELNTTQPHPSVWARGIRAINSCYDVVFIEACMRPIAYNEIWRERQDALLRTGRAYLVV